MCFPRHKQQILLCCRAATAVPMHTLAERRMPYAYAGGVEQSGASFKQVARREHQKGNNTPGRSHNSSISTAASPGGAMKQFTPH